MSARTTRSPVRPLTVLLILLVSPPALFAQEGAVQGVHDPCIIKEKDTYYVFSTGPGITVRKSRDLIEWTRVGKVLDETPAWALKAVPGVRANLWAPDIAFFNGKYYLYYSVSTFGSRRSCIGLATNKTLDAAASDYQWVDEGMVISTRPEDDWNAIDPNVALDEEGTPWLSLGSFWGGLKLVKLDPRTGKRADETIHPIAARPVEKAIEAPFIVRKNGCYYLFASWDHCCRGVNSDYKIVVGRSRSITGPYVDREGTPMMRGGGTLVLASYDTVKGPGHNAVLTEGDRDWLVHHFYDANRRGIATLQVRPLLWADDGWPLAGEPLVRSEPGRKEKDEPRATGVWELSVNFGAPEKVKLAAGGKIGQGPAAWELKGPVLLLHWPGQTAGDKARVDRCVLSADGKSFVGRNEQGAVVRGKWVSAD